LERAPEAAEQVAGFLGGMPFARRLGWVTVLHWVMDEGPKLSGAELKRTIGDFCANVDRDKWTPTHFRGYSRGARREPAIAVVSDTPQGTAGQVFATIRSLVTEIPNPGRGIIRAIPKAKVAELGARALAAYDQIGGAERFLDQREAVGFLLRDFTNAYNSTTQPQRVSA